jgi:glycosyltransferase involved in cell wall biosynthesis
MEIVGTPEQEVLDMVEKADVADLVQHVGPLPYAETMSRLATSRALAVITFTTPGSEGELTTKLFEYLAVGRPILALTLPGSELGMLVDEAGGGVFHPSDIGGIANWLRAQFEQPYGQSRQPTPPSLATLTRQHLTSLLARQLDEIS